jgi:LemA protein
MAWATWTTNGRPANPGCRRAPTLQFAQKCYNRAMTAIYVLIGVVVLAALWVMVSYNHLITLVQRTKEAWADIDVQLKRRYDLIPNLVESVKGYATHEREAFENVTAARASAMNAGTSPAQKGAAENMLSGALKTLFAVAEAYPDLKANQNFMELQRQLTDTEDKIQSARRFYNGNVRDLNTSIQSFPGNIIAGAFHFEAREFFELGDTDAAAREPVAVKF